MAQPYTTPVQYKVLEKSLIGNELFDVGATPMWDGHPGANLEPMCDEGRARYQKTLELNKAHMEQLAQKFPSDGLDAEAFMREFRKELAESQTSQAQVIAEAIASAFERLTSPPAKSRAKNETHA